MDIKFDGPFFNEFVLEFSKPWADIDSSLKEKKILGGLGLDEYFPELKDCALICVTEKQKKEEIDRLVESLKEIV